MVNLMIVWGGVARQGGPQVVLEVVSVVAVGVDGVEEQDDGAKIGSSTAVSDMMFRV